MHQWLSQATDELLRSVRLAQDAAGRLRGENKESSQVCERQITFAGCSRRPPGSGQGVTHCAECLPAFARRGPDGAAGSPYLSIFKRVAFREQQRSGISDTGLDHRIAASSASIKFAAGQCGPGAVCVLSKIAIWLIIWRYWH